MTTQRFSVLALAVGLATLVCCVARAPLIHQAMSPGVMSVDTCPPGGQVDEWVEAFRRKFA